MNEDILNKINALRSKITENGATEEEAMAALAMADKLMNKHGVSEEDLRNVEFKRDMKQSEFHQRQKATHPVHKYCSVVIGKFCGVKVWGTWDSGVKNKKITALFGFHGDVEMAEFLMNLIHDSMERGWKEFLATTPKEEGVSRHTQYWNFMMGFGYRVNDKIKELMITRQTEATGTDLIEIKEALVEQGRDALFPDLDLRKNKKSSVNVDVNAFLSGTAAGDRVNIQRPLQNSGHTGKQIK